MVLQWCYNGVTMVLQWCYNGVTMVLQWCYNGVCAHLALLVFPHVFPFIHLFHCSLVRLYVGGNVRMELCSS
jgi:hypothetical protein